MAAKRSVLGAIGLLLLSSCLCFAWGGLSIPQLLDSHHKVLTELALLGMGVDAEIAKKIAEHADGPDVHRELCKKLGWGPCPWGGPCPIEPTNTSCSDTHAHRITLFMHKDEEDRYGKEGQKGGAEKGAAYWAQRARGAYLVYSRTTDPNDKRKWQQYWQQYLGWATHYLADALSPASCYDPNNQEMFEFWRKLVPPYLPPFFDTREDLLESGIQIFDWHLFKGLDICTAIGLLKGSPVTAITCAAIEEVLPRKEWEGWLKNYREWVKNPTSIVVDDFNPQSPEDIVDWIAKDPGKQGKPEQMGKARQVANMLLEPNKPLPSWPYLSQEDLKKVFAWISIGIRGLYRYVTGQRVTPTTHVTATVLVIDVSGSMAWQWRGGVKIESAKKAALQFIEQVANEPRQPGSFHVVGVVTFSDDASVVCPLTDDYNYAKNTIIRLGTIASTNLGAGLTVALSELDKLPSSAKRFIILLSDGVITSGLPPEQVLARPVAEARAKGICIHAVGFGDPGDIDEDFLKKVAQQSGCGTYHYAASGFELFGTYIKIRHAMLGSNRTVEFSSGSPPVRMLPGQTATLGAFQLTAPAQELHYTLAWSEPGDMRAILVDPSGRQVTATYPNTVIYSGNGFMHITVFSPQSGIWRASAAANTSFLSGVQYYGVVSARTGGVVIPIPMPTICFTVSDQKICIPLPDMPTLIVVLIGVGVAIYILYTRFLAP